MPRLTVACLLLAACADAERPADRSGTCAGVYTTTAQGSGEILATGSQDLDPDGHLVRAHDDPVGGDDTTRIYAWDGDLLASDAGDLGSDGSYEYLDEYSYDADDRLVLETQRLPEGDLTFAYGYDDAGEQVSWELYYGSNLGYSATTEWEDGRRVRTEETDDQGLTVATSDVAYLAAAPALDQVETQWNPWTGTTSIARIYTADQLVEERTTVDGVAVRTVVQAWDGDLLVQRDDTAVRDGSTITVRTHWSYDEDGRPRLVLQDSLAGDGLEGVAGSAQAWTWSCRP